MRFEFIRVEKGNFPVSILCCVLEVSRSGFYAWIRRPAAPRDVKQAELTVRVKAAHERSRGTYGSPRVHRELQAQGVVVSLKTVAKSMRNAGIQGRSKRRFKRTTDSRHADPIAPNVLARHFDASAPNQVWVTDVTAIATSEGWLYLAVMLDLYARRVVAWATSANNDTSLALEALSKATRGRKPHRGLLHHSDRGSPYASAAYRKALDDQGIVQSMSRKGDCWDNAVAESFFATLRAELVDHVTYPTHAAARRSLADYIDAFYNLERRHSSIGYINPVEHELRFAIQLKAA
jgi:transposase InsO family protein